MIKLEERIYTDSKGVKHVLQSFGKETKSPQMAGGSRIPTPKPSLYIYDGKEYDRGPFPGISNVFLMMEKEIEDEIELQSEKLIEQNEDTNTSP